MSTAQHRGAQLIAVALVAAGLFGMWHEPTPTDPTLLAAHLVHYKVQAGLVAAGLLMFDPLRVSKALLGIAQAWKAKS